MYRSGTQGVKVRGLILLSIAVLAGCCYWGWQIAFNDGMISADGGQVAPLWQRLSIAGAIVTTAVAFAWGMLFYGAHYIDRLECDAAGVMTIRTIGLLRGAQYMVNEKDIATVEARHDDFVSEGGLAVNAPWLKLQLKNGLPWLILDQQGVFTDDLKLREVLRRTMGI